MAEEISIDSLKEMKKADFVKAFKNKAVWKKAKAVIILVDYKLDGKKSVIAIPFRKETDMKAEMKRLKKEKLHILKKSGGGSIEFNKTPDGMSAKVEIQLGGLSTELLLMKGQPLFDKIKVKLEALQTAEAMAEAAASAGEVDPNESLAEDNFSDVTEEEMEEEETGEILDTTVEESIVSEEKKTKRVAVLEKITQNISTLEVLLSKGAAEKVSEKVTKYKGVVQKMSAEGGLDALEQKSVTELLQKLVTLEGIITEVPKAIEIAQKIKTLLEQINAIRD